MIPCGRLVNKHETLEETLVMFADQPEDSERCESMELDNKIRDLIEKNASPGPRADATMATPSHSSSFSLKTRGETASMAHTASCRAGASGVDGATEPAECANPSRGKNSMNSLEQKIRCLEKQRKELLEVNQQWDQQFRSMKELYERKVAELRTKLEVTERSHGTLEKDQSPGQRDGDRPRDLAPEQQEREEKEKESLGEELHELKKENRLLKEKNALMNRKKEHYECEIKRLNKALQDALKIESPSPPEDGVGMFETELSHEELRTEMEVLRQQVQIYEEDFKRERSDRERLNQEKEDLQRVNHASQSQLHRLKSQMKACQMEKEKLEQQLRQMNFPTCRCDLGCHLRDPCVLTNPGARLDLPQFPPDCQWRAPDPLPPDVRHLANGVAHQVRAAQTTSESTTGGRPHTT